MIDTPPTFEPPSLSVALLAAMSIVSTCGPVVLRELPPPGPVPDTARFHRAGLRARLTWEPAADATSYDVYVGPLGSLRTGSPSHAPLPGGCDLAATELLVALEALPGDTFVLVRGRNAAGDGPLGFDSAGSAFPTPVIRCP